MAVRLTRAGLGLTVGIIILGLVVLGGLYLAKQRGEQARREAAIEVAQQNLESQSKGTGSLNPDTDSTKDTPKDESKSSGASSGSSSSTSGSTGSTGSSESTVDELPQTGTVDVAPALALGMITFAVASYVSSRRTLFQTR